MNYRKAWLELKSRIEDLKVPTYEDSSTRPIRALGGHILEIMEQIEEETSKDAELKISDEVSSNMVRKNVYIVQRNKLGEYYKIIAPNKDSALRALKNECKKSGAIFKEDKVVFVSEFESEIVGEREKSINCLSPLELMSLNHFLNTSEQKLIDLKNN